MKKILLPVLSLCFLPLSSVSSYAQGAAPEMFGVREVVVDYARFIDPKAADACGLTREEIAGVLAKSLKDSGVPALPVGEAKPPSLGVARIELIPQISAHAGDNLDCVSWVSLAAENRANVVVPPVSTLRGVTIIYWRQQSVVSSSQSQHAPAVDDVIEKMAAQFAQQYRLDQPSSAPRMSDSGARRLRLVITSELAGQRLDKVLSVLAAAQEPGLSRARVQALLGDKQVFFDGKVLDSASHKAKADDVYILTLPPTEKAEPEAQDIALNIVYEDDDVIVIDKPAGMVVHPAPGNRDMTLVNALLAHCGGSLSGIGGVARPGIVHRLDKDTSGLMVVAKNDVAHQALTKQFADRSLSRTYNAVVWGVPVPMSGSVEASIGRSLKDRKKMAVMAKGRFALTHYKVIEDLGAASVVECKLATGRTHQIRVHLAHIKHPVVGDATYGGSRRGKAGLAAQKFPRQALHAVGLQFVHPRTGKLRKFASKLPVDMRKLIKALEREAS